VHTNKFNERTLPAWSTVHLQNLTVNGLLRKFPTVMEPEGWYLC